MKKKLHVIGHGGRRFAALALALIMIAALVMGGCEEQPDVIPPDEPAPPPVILEPEPEPEPEPVFYYPLTGLEAPDEMVTHNRVISVKIENTPEAKPQLGITRADIVYETVTEGGITRFNALFQSDIPDEVGPVRSARDSDMSIVPEYNALFFFSGTNSLVWSRLATTSINEMNHSSAPSLYHRVSYRSAPHNLFLDLSGAYETAEEMGYPLYEMWPKGLVFGEQDMSKLGDADDAISIFIPYSGGIFDVMWEYDPSTGRYMRFIKGEPQVDLEEGSPQMYADNVILLEIPYLPAADVPGKGQTYNLDTTGSGPAVVFRDGKRIDCTWACDGITPPRFTDHFGNEVMLKPGKTWFQIPPKPEQMVVKTGHPEIDDPVETTEDTTDTTAEDVAAYQAADAADVD